MLGILRDSIHPINPIIRVDWVVSEGLGDSRLNFRAPLLCSDLSNPELHLTFDDLLLRPPKSLTVVDPLPSAVTLTAVRTGWFTRTLVAGLTQFWLHNSIIPGVPCISQGRWVGWLVGELVEALASHSARI